MKEKLMMINQIDEILVSLCNRTAGRLSGKWPFSLMVVSQLIFKCTKGAGVGDYSSQTPPRPLSSFDTHQEPIALMQDGSK